MAVRWPARPRPHGPAPNGLTATAPPHHVPAPRASPRSPTRFPAPRPPWPRPHGSAHRPTHGPAPMAPPTPHGPAHGPHGPTPGPSWSLMLQAHIYSLGATLKAALDYVLEPDPQPRLSQELEALLGQMQAEDPGDRPDLQVNSQACLASPQEIP